MVKKSTCRQKLLIITASGGGGLLQAAIAKEQEALEKDPKTIIIKIDLMKEWVNKFIGTFGINTWDSAQRKGNVRSQENLVWFQGIAEVLFWPQVFFNALRCFFKQKVTRVVDTQPIGTSAIIKAIRTYNWIAKKKLYLEKVIVDLPTKKSTHFFNSIKLLSKKDKKFVKLLTIEPLLENGESEDQFWDKCCRLSKKAVIYEKFPIRHGFKSFLDKKRSHEPFNIKIRVNNKIVKSVTQKIAKRGHLKEIETASTKLLEFEIGKDDVLVTILLGSQPAYRATLKYVSKFIELAKDIANNNKKIDLFVFCSDYEPKHGNLFHDIMTLITERKDYPSNLSVIPMIFQKDDIIAPLFFRSDVTITRSGGQTIMELMAVSSAKIWIHSEAKRKKEITKELSLEELLKGIPVWEAGNACYLKHKSDGKIVTPDCFDRLMIPIIS
jgi:hypothetical protein